MLERARPCASQYSLCLVSMSTPIRRGMTRVPAIYIPVACKARPRVANGHRKDGAISHQAIPQTPIHNTVFGEKEISSEVLRMRAARTRGQEGNGPLSALSSKFLSSTSDKENSFSNRTEVKDLKVF